MSTGPVVRVCKFKGMQHGDKVFIADMNWPQFAGVTFFWLNYAENIETGIGWAEVFGGPKGKQWVRCFPIHSVRVPARRA